MLYVRIVAIALGAVFKSNMAEEVESLGTVFTAIGGLFS